MTIFNIIIIVIVAIIIIFIINHCVSAKFSGRFQTLGEDEIANSWMETRVRRQIYKKTTGLFTIYMGKPVDSRFG